MPFLSSCASRDVNIALFRPRPTLSDVKGIHLGNPELVIYGGLERSSIWDILEISAVSSFNIPHFDFRMELMIKTVCEVSHLALFVQ
jgi:hypothetical protein